MADNPVSMNESIMYATHTGVGRLGHVLRPTRFHAYQQSVVDLVNGEFQRRQDERRPWDLQWRLALAFLDGKQYLEVNSEFGDLAEIPKLYWWQEREVFNHTSPTIETRIARLGRMWPKLTVRPATSEREDISAAKIEARLLDVIQNERMTPTARQTLLSWLEACGTVFVKTTWNPQKGRIVGYQEVSVFDDQPDIPHKEKTEFPEEDDGFKIKAAEMTMNLRQIDPELGINITEEEGGVIAETYTPIHEGDLDPMIISPFEIYPDSAFRQDMQAVRSLIHARVYHVDEVYQRTGIRVEPDEAGSYTMMRDSQQYGGMGYGAGGFHTSVKQLKDHVIVKDYYEMPSMAFPEGRMVSVAGDFLIWEQPKLPYLVGPDSDPAIPFVRLCCIQKPNSFWGRAVIDRIIPIQRRINALRNRKAEYMTRFAIGQIIAEEDSIVDEEQLENRGSAPGEVIYFTKGAQRPPKYLEFQQWPVAFETEHQNLLNELAQISGVSETSARSQAPAGVKSGVALSLLLEQDDTRLSLTVANIEAGMVECGRQWLRLYRQYVDFPRLIKTVGRDREVDLLEWDKTDIRSDDVVLQTTALQSDSPTQRRQMIYEMIQMGLFLDTETGRLTKEGKAKIFELLQFGDYEMGNDFDDMMIQRAEKESRIMAQGQLVMPKPYDDDGLHMTQHIKYMLDSRFEQENEQAGGMLEQIFMQHMQMHAISMQVKAGVMAPPSMPQGAVEGPEGPTEVPADRPRPPEY